MKIICRNYLYCEYECSHKKEHDDWYKTCKQGCRQDIEKETCVDKNQIERKEKLKKLKNYDNDMS